MDEHRLSKRSYKISIESRKSNLSSCRSLQRPSWCEREKSLSNKHSLIDVMSLQGGKGERKSDIFDKMLDVPSEPLFNRQSLGGQGESYNYSNNYNDPYNPNQFQFEAPSSVNQRKSEETNGNIKHTCSCYTDCEWQICECFLAKNQMCIKQFCCIGCIEMKSKMLRCYQLPMQNEQQHQGLFCTCKKTKCNKKYCSCFAAGVHCGQKCSCEGCINCPRKSQHMEMEQQRQEISQEELARMQMPQSMDFEPVQFRMSNN